MVSLALIRFIDGLGIVLVFNQSILLNSIDTIDIPVIYHCKRLSIGSSWK